MNRNATLPAAILLSLLAMLTGPQAATAERWYDAAQLARGEQVYASRCASCHGDQAQGLVEDWRKTGPDGNYPPPPLNGTAHAWHHPLNLLRKTVREGGVKLGGHMPGFADQLDATDIDAVLAWVQSHWSEDVYAAWLERGGLNGSGLDNRRDDANDVLRLLRQRSGGLSLGEPRPSPVAGILAVPTAKTDLYLSADGRHVFIGDLIDLEQGVNLSEQARRNWRLGQLDGFAATNRVVFPAQGAEKAQLTVFTDTSCPFCAKLHAETDALRQAGISIHYLPFPRGGMSGPGYAQLRTVWCADDRMRALDQALRGSAETTPSDAPASCAAANAVDAGYRLGQTLGISGTPTMILPDGQIIDGYRPAAALIKALWP